MHPVQIYHKLLKRLFGQWLGPAERAVKVAHDIQMARRRAARRPLPRMSGRPVLRVIQGGKSLRSSPQPSAPAPLSPLKRNHA